jgi:hypothetical protein
MSQLSRRTRFAGLVIPLILLAFSGVAAANGSAFFKPASSNEKVDLVYFGTIKGTRGQNLDFVECELGNGVFEVRWENDRPGHYRSPDIGKFIKGYGQPVDPKALQITCFADGLELVSQGVPNKSQGIHEVDFVLPPIPGEVSFTDVFAESERGREAPRGHSAWMWVVPGLLALVAIGAAVRK